MFSFTVILIPFLGTILGAAWVFFLKNGTGMSQSCHRLLAGFAAGVMTAASVWSLLLPAIDRSAHLGHLTFLPAALGFWVGILFLMALDRTITRLQKEKHYHTPLPEAAISGSSPKQTPFRPPERLSERLLYLAVTLHNLPEGMAVGVALAAALSASGSDAFTVTATAALSLSLGIAIQNLPEGAILSLPLYAGGQSKGRAFLWGALSGAVEPLGALMTLWISRTVTASLPFLLSFAAGSMIYVVVEELIPSMATDADSPLGTLAFTAGFTFMMILDVALG